MKRMPIRHKNFLGLFKSKNALRHREIVQGVPHPIAITSQPGADRQKRNIEFFILQLHKKHSIRPEQNSGNNANIVHVFSSPSTGINNKFIRV